MCEIFLSSLEPLGSQKLERATCHYREKEHRGTLCVLNYLMHIYNFHVVEYFLTSLRFMMQNLDK